MASRQGRMYGLTASREADRLARVDRALQPDRRIAVPSGLIAEVNPLMSPGDVPLMVHGDQKLRADREIGSRATEHNARLGIYRTGGIRKLTNPIADTVVDGDGDDKTTTFINGYSDKIDSKRIIPRSRNRSKSSRKRKIRAS